MYLLVCELRRIRNARCNDEKGCGRFLDANYILITSLLLSVPSVKFNVLIYHYFFIQMLSDIHCDTDQRLQKTKA